MDFNAHPTAAPNEQQLHLLAQQATADTLAQTAGTLSVAELAELVPLLIRSAAAHEKKHDLREKLCALVAGLDDAAKLQAVGQALSFTGTCALLEAAAEGDEGVQKRLAPLLVGMTPAAFAETLSQATQAQLSALKQQAPTEPLQHQLSGLAHTLTGTLGQGQLAFETLQRDICELPLANIDQDRLRTVADSIANLRRGQLAPLQTIDHALSLAWNTSRADLIEKFSHLKELYFKHINSYIGMPASEATPSTGLYKTLRERLDKVFGDTSDDSEAAIDALANFSIWYLQDYWEIGLLPDIPDLELLLTGKTESERAAQRGVLFNIAKSNLEKLGLVTLKDLKSAHIYSKKALKDYISAHNLKASGSS